MYRCNYVKDKLSNCSVLCDVHAITFDSDVKLWVH